MSPMLFWIETTVFVVLFIIYILGQRDFNKRRRALSDSEGINYQIDAGVTGPVTPPTTSGNGIEVDW